MAFETLKDVNEELYRRYRWVRERIPIESGNYPYVTARVKAKRGLLMPEETYGRLLQMSIPEIARFLGEREYKDEMVALGAKYAGVDLIEMAMSRNLAKTYTQIYEFCEGDLRTMVARYLGRWDLENVKTIVRGKVHGAPMREIEEDLVAAGSFGEEFLQDLVAADRLEDVFADLEGTIYAQALDILKERPGQVSNWAAWEDLVSKLYYQELLSSIPPSTDANRLMREFVQREIDIVNLKTLLRAWAAKAAFARSIFLPGGRELDVEDLEEIVALDHAGLTSRLSGYSFYGRIADDLARVESTGVGVLIRRVEKVHLVEATRYGHLHPLSILPVLDFIVRKDREVQNVRIVARGKESGLPLDVIRDLLVV